VPAGELTALAHRGLARAVLDNGGAAAVGLALLYTRRPALAAGIAFFLSPLEWRVTLTLGGEGLPLSSTLIIVPLLLLTAMATGRLGCLVERGRSVLVWYAVFVAVAFASLLDAPEAWYGMRKAAELALGLGYFCLTLASLDNARDVRTFVGMAGLSLARVLVLTYWQYGTGVVRVAAPFGHDAILGAFVSLTVAVTVGLAWSTLRGWVRATCCAGTVLLGFAAIGMSGSRGAFLSLAVVTVVLAWLLGGANLSRRARYIAVGLVLALAVPLTFILTLSGRPVARFFDPTYGTNSFRLSVWGGAVDLFTQNPVTGVGYMNPGGVLQEALGLTVYHSHNLYLELLAGLGLVGGLAIILLAVALLREMRGLTRARPVVAGVAAALAGFLVQGLVDFTLWDMRYALPLAAVVGLPLVCRVKLKPETETR
jgi:O-antigen ligase